MWKLSQIVKMLVKSCFLITLIKCLKGHRSLGLLFFCQVVKSLVSDSVSEWLSQWQGHLLSCSGQLKKRITEIEATWQRRENRSPSLWKSWWRESWSPQLVFPCYHRFPVTTSQISKYFWCNEKHLSFDRTESLRLFHAKKKAWAPTVIESSSDVLHRITEKMVEERMMLETLPRTNKVP